MEPTIILLILALSITVVISNEYEDFPVERLKGRFDGIIQRTKANGGHMSNRDVYELNELKQDMLEDCADGKLQEYSGNQRYEFTRNYVVPTKVYLLSLSKDLTRDDYYWVLPSVDCNFPSLEGKSYNSAKDVVPSNEYNEFPYDRLLGRFHGILERTKENGRYMSGFDLRELELLKKDILEDCTTGKLTEYTGPQEYSFLQNYDVPTKLYLLHISKDITIDNYYWALPAVNCNDPETELGTYVGNVQGNIYDNEDEGRGNKDTSQDSLSEEERPMLASDTEILSYIKRVRSGLNRDGRKSGITMADVKKPPKMRHGKMHS